MPAEHAPHNLASLLDHLEHAHDESGRVSLAALLDAVGHRSFGAALLVPGLLLLTPLSGIPGMATTMGLIAALIAGQLLFGRRSFWLPGWLTRRSLDHRKFCVALRKLRRPARFVDRLLRPRLLPLVRKPAVHIIAALCMTAGLVMPALEFIPFADTGPGVALTAFGLGLIAQDGLLAGLAGLLCVLSFGLGFVALL